MNDDNRSDSLPSTQQQSLGDVQIHGDDNIFNAIQATVVTLTQNKIIQVSVDEIKTRPFIKASPYKGLRSFEPEDKDQFFGREQFLAGLVNELEQTNLILLLGASGSGKSSVVRAGLVPWLSQQWGPRLVNLTLTPDQDPFDSFYASLLGRFKQSEAKLVRAGQTDSLSQLVKRLKRPESFWFIFIDQFEELFTVSDPEKRDRFITSLAELCQEQAAERTLKVVATMRADFLDRLDAEPANRLARLTEKHRPLMTQMHPDELRLAIEQPAAHHGVVFEQGLVETIIKDVQGQAGYLPLLQYTLNQLWEQEVDDGGIYDRTLNIQSYRLLGGVRGALQKRMSQIYDALSEAEKLAAQRIFLKLVGIGGNSATDADWKPVRKREVRSRFTDPLEQAVLTKLINANLLVSDAPAAAAKATVEITHEILLTSWDELRDWIEQNREAIALRNRISEDAAHWQLEKLDDELWSGTKLALAIELKNDATFNQVLGGFSPDVSQFIEASQSVRDRKEREKEARRRRTMFGLAGFSTVALLLAGTALYQLQQAQRQRVEQLAATAEALLDTQPVEATVHAIAAYGLSQSPFVQFPGQPKFDAVENSLINAQRANSERQRFVHTDAVYSAALSPDNKTVASGTGDGTVTVWHAEAGVIKYQRNAHQEEVVSIIFSPDGKTIASSSIDGTIALWDAQTGVLKHRIKEHQEVVYSVAFSPDSNTLASGSKDSTLRLWDVQTGESIRPPLTGHGDMIYSVVFSPDGSTIASGSKDKTVRLWNAQTGKLKLLLKGHTDEVLSVAFSPRNNIIASGSFDDTIRLWNIQTGNEVDKLTEYGAGIRSVAYSPDGKTIIGAGNRAKGKAGIQLWDARTREPLDIPLFGHQTDVHSIGFSSDGSIIVSGSPDKTVRLWKTRTNALLVGHTDEVYSIAFSPEGNTIASGGANSTVRLWDVKTGNLKLPLTEPQGQVRSVAFSPDGNTVAGGSSNGTIQIWNTQTGNTEHSFDIHEGLVIPVIFSPKGNTIASGSVDRTIRIWDAQTGEVKQVLDGHTDEVLSIAFSPDGNTLASSSKDNTVRLWNPQTGALTHTLTEHNDDIYSIAFSPTEKMIVSGSKDTTIRRWDLTGSVPKEKPLISAIGPIESVAFSPDGRILAGGTQGGLVQLWDAHTGKLKGDSLTGHLSAVYSVAFSPADGIFASGSADSSVRIWNVSPDNFKAACKQLRSHSIFASPSSSILLNRILPDTLIEQARATCSS